MKKAGKEILKLLLTILIIGVVLVGGMYLIDHFSTKESHADSPTAAPSNYFTYTFTYYEEYYTDGKNEWYGEDVIGLCKNDIVNKQNNGYATADFSIDSYTMGAWTEDYNCFSAKYYLIEKTVSVKLLRGETPNLASLREDFDVFYHEFLYWTTKEADIYTNKAYIDSTIPAATKDMVFIAKYDIAEKIYFNVKNDKGFESTLSNNAAPIELFTTKVKFRDEEKTVYYYGWHFYQAFDEGKITSIYQYFVFRGAYLNQEGTYKVGVCNIRDDEKLITVDYTGFTNQNEFNKFRSGYTGKTYYATLGNALCDLTYSLFGETGVVSNVCSVISSGASIAETSTGAIASGIFIYADLLSNIKVGLTYILVIGIACFATFFILKFVFFLIKAIGGMFRVKKKKN